MTVLNEEVAAQSYLQDYLESDSTLSGLVNGVTFRSAWSDLTPPFVKIERLDAVDLNAVGPFRVWADLTYLVRGIVQATGRGLPDWSDVQAIADRIDVLLQAHQGSDSTIEVESFREESYTDETVEGGDLYLHAGGIYRLRAHAL